MGCLYLRSSSSLAVSYSLSVPFIYHFAVIQQKKRAEGACNGNMVDMALQATACRGRGEVMSQFMIYLPHFS